MKKSDITTCVLVFIIALLLCACGKSTGYDEDSYNLERRFSPLMVTANDYIPRSTANSNIRWEGTGFISERSDESEPLVYRDMNNIFDTGINQNSTSNTQAVEIALTEQAAESRKLTKSADIRLRVEDPSATEQAVTELMNQHSAWAALTESNERSRNYSIRVPAGNYESLLDSLASIGRVLSRTETTDDVTLRYYDLEGRLATRQELLRTYQGYLGRAGNIDEIMTVERRIADLQWEIDQTGTQFRNLVHHIDYSIINVEIYGPLSSGSYSIRSFGEKIGLLFSTFGHTLSTILVIVIGAIIYGIPIIIICFLLYLILFGRVGLIRRLMSFAQGKKREETQ